MSKGTFRDVWGKVVFSYDSEETEELSEELSEEQSEALVDAWYSQNRYAIDVIDHKTVKIYPADRSYSVGLTFGSLSAVRDELRSYDIDDGVIFDAIKEYRQEYAS